MKFLRIVILAFLISMIFTFCYSLNNYKFFDGGNKLDLPKNTCILNEKEGPIYKVRSKERVLLLATKDDPQKPFWSMLWFYVDQGRLINETIYPLKGNHLLAAEPKLELSHLLSKYTNEILISSRNPGSGGLLNLIIYTCYNGRPKAVFDSDFIDYLSFSGQYLDNYKAEIIFPDSTSQIINLKSRKKIYQDAHVYQNDMLLKPVNLWGTQLVNFKLKKGKNGLQYLIVYQEVRGTNNTDRIALITTKLQYQNNQWQILQRKVKTYK